jgi:hypothetical protein
MAGERGRLSFNFVLSADAQAGDQVDDLRDQIEAQGHIFVVTRGQFLPPPIQNVFSEGTRETLQHPNRMHEMARAGYALIALVTEQPTLVTREGLVWNYMTSESWERRAEIFVEVAPALTAAWSYVPGAAAVLRRFVRSAADIEMAWGARFDRIRSTAVPQFDFCFFGGMTTRRQRVLAAIAKRGHKLDIIPHSSTLARRDERIPHSKIVLDIKQYHWWELVSSVRYVTALACQRPVVAETRSPHAQRGWENAVRFASPETFAETAAECLAFWAQLYERQVTALKGKPDTIAAAIRMLPTPLPAPRFEVAPPPPPSPPARVEPPPHQPGRRGGPPRLLEVQAGTNFVEWQGAVYAIPQRVGKIEIDKADISRFPGIRKFGDLATARQGVKKR